MLQRVDPGSPHDPAHPAHRGQVAPPHRGRSHQGRAVSTSPLIRWNCGRHPGVHQWDTITWVSTNIPPTHTCDTHAHKHTHTHTYSHTHWQWCLNHPIHCNSESTQHYTIMLTPTLTICVPLYQIQQQFPADLHYTGSLDVEHVAVPTTFGRSVCGREPQIAALYFSHVLNGYRIKHISKEFKCMHILGQPHHPHLGN